MALFLPMVAAADVSTGVDEDAQLPFWEWRSEGMSIRWVQRLPDQSRAFFAARQFNGEDVELIATSCVFQTIYKNSAADKSATVIEYDLADWRVRQDDKTQGIKLKKTWLAEWQKRNTPAAARIAFEWSLLPTKHRLLAGDYNWGMTTFGLKPGEKFDLEIVWKKDGVSNTATIPDIECAKDIHPEPKAPIQ
jgi:hypothetical protein